MQEKLEKIWIPLAYKPTISCISLKNDAATAFIFSCIRECPTFKMHGKMCNFILRTHYFCSTLQNSGGLVVSVTSVVKLERAELIYIPNGDFYPFDKMILMIWISFSSVLTLEFNFVGLYFLTLLTLLRIPFLGRIGSISYVLPIRQNIDILNRDIRVINTHLTLRKFVIEPWPITYGHYNLNPHRLPYLTSTNKAAILNS